MIKKIWRKLQFFIKRNAKVVIAFGIFVVAFAVFLVGNAFAALTPTKSVIITSQKTSFKDKEPGSWQVEKSGKWISKGKARVTFDVDTTLMTKNKDKDIIFVLDISGSMIGDKLDRVKIDSTELIESLLSNKNNNAALITFDTGSTIVSDFTNDKVYLINEINNLKGTGSTNYYQPLVNVDTILKDYVKTDDKEVIVLFLTDGYPNIDVPNQIAQYETLKKNYPYITVNGIQYEMGGTILNPIKEISDNQFFADMETLNNVLFDASVVPISYDEFKIVDYIDNDYFTLDSEYDITVSQGSVKLEEENGKQKITWTIPSFKSGRNAKLTMDINLKDEYIGQGGIYPTNDSEEIISKIVNAPDEDVSSTKTPVLADNYKVIYDGNSPDGSTVSNVPDEANYSVFDTISISTEEPSCVGYEFKGWEIANKGVARVGDDYFIMPGEDVIIRAKWSKVEVSKSMNGTVNTRGEPIMRSYSSIYTYNSVDYHSSEIKRNVTSIVTKNNIYIPATAIEYWDVSAAGDGSVIAYIEDDGSGNGTYKVTIGGEGGIIAPSNSTKLFLGFYNLKSIDLSYLDTSRVVNMGEGYFELKENNGYSFVNTGMFSGCSSLEYLNLSNFDTSRVTSMELMFADCTNLKEIDLSGFDFSKVTSIHAMFILCENLEKVIFDDNIVSPKLSDSSFLFYRCFKLKSANLESLDTANIKDMSYMFSLSSIEDMDFSGWNTSRVTNMKYLFNNCDFTKLDLSNFDTSNVTDMSNMFYACWNLTELNISSFITDNVVNMAGMFYGCSITSLDLSNFNTSNVTSMSNMFDGCSDLTSLDLSSFDTSNVTSMSYMFDGCRSLTSLDISHFNMSNVIYMYSMFSDCSNLTGLDLSNFETSNVINMGEMFYACSNLTSLDLNNFDTSKVTNMENMFYGCRSLTSLDLSSFDTSNVASMGNMFYGCSSLTSLDLSSFDTSNVTVMNAMFYGCQNLISLDLSSFDTSKVTSMGGSYYQGMFSKCSSLISLDLSSFDTSKVTSMGSMFYGCSSLTSLDLSSFDTSKVTSMENMFDDCNSLTSLDLSSFDTSKVTSMYSMFDGCSNLISLDFRSANFSSVTSYVLMFFSTNSNINVIVKDSEAESFVRARLDDASRPNATVTIANPASQTSLFELGPREFGPFYFGGNPLSNGS